MTAHVGDSLPLVSVITPAYNRASYLDETIQSVLNQDYPHLEYIVLDDGSTDDTREVLAQYTGRIIWETHPNMGETRTANKGFSMAKGEIVVVVNSDDPLLPGAVREAVAFMQGHPDILVGYPDWNLIGPDSEVIRHMQVREYDYLDMVRLFYCTPGPGAFIRRRAFELTGGRDPAFRYAGDLEYWLRLGLYGEFARIPRTLATFRVHPDSASVSQRGKAMADEYVRLVDGFYSRPDLPPEVHRVRARAFSSMHFIAAWVCSTDRREARRHIMASFRYNPLSFLLSFQKLASIPLSLLPEPVGRLLIRTWRAGRRMWQSAARFLATDSRKRRSRGAR